MDRWTRTVRECLGHRRLPLVFAVGAVLLRLPALGAGLFMDDLVQRVIELRPEELPPQIQQTGFGSPESGKLGTVICDLFGLSRRTKALELAKDYGLLAWWMPETIKAALWRPFTAFTQCVDYRMFPNTPRLMHAHNVAWFAAAVTLLTLVYHQLVRITLAPKCQLLRVPPQLVQFLIDFPS